MWKVVEYFNKNDYVLLKVHSSYRYSFIVFSGKAATET